MALKIILPIFVDINKDAEKRNVLYYVVLLSYII